MVLYAGIRAEKDRYMRETECRRKLLNLEIIRRILNGKPWLSVGWQQACVYFLRRAVGTGLDSYM